VYRLAGLTIVRTPRTNPVDYWRTNVRGTLVILHKLARRPSGPGRSRVKLRDLRRASRATHQRNSSLHPPSSLYATSKLAADQAAADLAATGAIGAISLRAFNVAGALPRHPDRDTTRLIPMAARRGRSRAGDPADGQHSYPDRAGWRPEKSSLPEIIADAWTALTSE